MKKGSILFAYRESKVLTINTVGSKGFVDRIKSMLGALALGRKKIEAGEFYRLREPSAHYNVHFGVKKGDIGLENAYLWNMSL